MATMATGASVFYPDQPQAATNLKTATLFTRINIRATPSEVKAALDSSPEIRNTFCLAHYSDVLVFNATKEEHMTHVRAVLQMLQNRGMKANLKRCAFTKPSWAEAGFHIEALGREDKQAFMVLLREHIAPEALGGVA